MCVATKEKQRADWGSDFIQIGERETSMSETTHCRDEKCHFFERGKMSKTAHQIIHQDLNLDLLRHLL